MASRRSAALSGLLLAAGTLLAVLPSTAGNTPIPAHGDVIVFADKAGGNEWWVEAVLSGGASGSVQSVDAMDTGGPWTAMTHHPEWGSWAASFHIEPGHQVRFRANWAGGEQAVSCWFDHPSGVEHCPTGTTTTSTTTTTTSSTTTSGSGGSCFAATFTIKAPNEWWQELYPSAAGHTVASAQDRVNGGAWLAMSHSSWGAWTSSVHTPAGSKVEFRVTDTAGATSTSLPFTWLDGTLTKGSAACGSSSSTTTTSSSSTSSTPPPPPPPGGVTFTSVKGNPWWVETVVKSTAHVTGVMAVFDCDPNRDPSDMTYHADWGKWALGLGGAGIPSGTRVSFLAYGDFPGFAASAQNYVWPDATPTAGCPADRTDWPVNGSTAEYHLHTHTTGRSIAANLHLRYVVPDPPYAPYWQGTCDGATTVTNPDGTQTTTNWTADAPTHPPVETRLPRVGFHIGQSTANQPSLPAAYVTDLSGQACFSDDSLDWNSTATGTQTKQVALVDANGSPRTLTVWHAEGGGGARVIEWETKVGLILHWSTSDMDGFTTGDLIRTDAPV